MTGRHRLPEDPDTADQPASSVRGSEARSRNRRLRNSPESLLLGGKITDIPDRVRTANPATYVRENAPPFLIQQGVKDLIVPVQQSMELAAKLQKMSRRC